MTRPFLAATLLAAAAATIVLGAAQTSRLVYIGTYTGPTSKGIYAFRFDDSSGRLTPVGLVAETPSPSFLTMSANGRYLFAVNETSSYNGEQTGSVTSFSIDATTAALKMLSTQASAGTDPCHLALDRTGRFLAVANYTSGTFAVLPVGTDGRLAKATSVVTNQGSGPNPDRQAGPHAHEVVFDSQNRYLIGADLGLDRLWVYRFDAGTGALTRSGAGTLPPGSGPRHLSFHSNGRWVFTINELASTVVAFNWDRSSGALAAAGDPISTLPANFQGTNSTAEIVMHPSGRFLYGSNRGHDSIAVFSVGATGALTLVEHVPTRGRTPRNFAIDPAGRWLIAANQESGTLAVFRIDQTTGKLSAVGPLTDVGSPVCVLFRP